MTAELSDYRNAIEKTLAAVAGKASSAAVASVEETAVKALDAAMASRVDLGAFDIAFRAPIAVSIGVRAYDIAAPKAKAGDRVFVHPTASWPAGYATLGNGFVTADGHVEVRLLTPVVGVAVDVKLPCQLIGFRLGA